ncbi:MAG: TetR/AcrR family transcriptional regulator [Planctomycetes bacterium]|nr:TetR/AcrR family transcriptional regulator [Planctomycetota bacterium]
MKRSTVDRRRKSARRAQTAPPRRRLDQILDAALKLFAEQGFAATDVQVIADQAGVGKGSIYRHFGNKDALLRATARHARNWLLREVDAAAEATTDPLTKLRSGIRAFLTFFDGHPEVIALLIQERAHFRGQQPLTFFEQREEAENPWTKVFDCLIRDRVFRDLPQARIHDTFSRFLFGTIFVNYFSGQSELLAPKCDELCDMLFNGLLAPT